MNVNPVPMAESNNSKCASNERPNFHLHECVTVGTKGVNCNNHEKANTNDRPIVIHAVTVVIGDGNMVTNVDSEPNPVQMCKCQMTKLDSKESSDQDFASPDIIILANKVDECTVKLLKESILEFSNGKNNIQIADVIIDEGVDQNFLDAVNRGIHTSKIIFLLLSKDFVTKTWPYVSKMSTLIDRLYSNTQSIIPMYLEESISLPMGLRSLYCLHFYRRDPGYTNALGKLLEEIFKA
ncbi:uncharacterized protein [Mytilus edulis]|uniref:uncharacterized protein n=1 Tax=Mytilus edulis TaxID=6550 RepID=UPI0039F02443